MFVYKKLGGTYPNGVRDTCTIDYKEIEYRQSYKNTLYTTLKIKVVYTYYCKFYSIDLFVVDCTYLLPVDPRIVSESHRPVRKQLNVKAQSTRTFYTSQKAPFLNFPMGF